MKRITKLSRNRIRHLKAEEPSRTRNLFRRGTSTAKQQARARHRHRDTLVRLSRDIGKVAAMALHGLGTQRAFSQRFVEPQSAEMRVVDQRVFLIAVIKLTGGGPCGIDRVA